MSVGPDQVSPPSADQDSNRDERTQREFMTKLVEHGIRQGQVKPCDPKGLTDALFMLIDGYNVHAVLESTEPTEMLKFASEHILSPLRIPHQEQNV